MLICITSNLSAQSPNIRIEQPESTGLFTGKAIAWGNNTSSQSSLSTLQTDVISAAVGATHSMFLARNGTVLTRGGNTSGQRNVPGGLTGVTAIAAGELHSVALKSDGSVVAWGGNDSNQIAIPFGLTGVTAISAGGRHTVALKSDGTVVAWGSNNSGQRTVPAGLANVIAVSAGANHTLALKSDGTLAAWGDNSFGQRTLPAALTDVIAISAGAYHNLALKNDGSVVAWGRNTNGQINIPAGLSGAIKVSAGIAHSLALKADGTVVVWGSSASGLQTLPAGLSGVFAIAPGSMATHIAVLTRSSIAFSPQPLVTTSSPKTFVIRNLGAGPLNLSGVIGYDGNVSDFVINTTGMLATVPTGGQTSFQVSFAPMALGTRKAILRVNSNDTDESAFDIELTGVGLPPEPEIVIEKDGPIGLTISKIFAWGSNNYGITNVPTGLTDVISIATGDSHAVALKSDGSVVTWGFNPSGQLTVPAGLTNVKAIAAASNHSAALKHDGTVVAWGDFNSNGNLSVPSNLTDVIAISVGATSLALKSNGTVVAWGDNSNYSTVVSGLTEIIAIAAGGGHNVALRKDGTVVAWGSNSHGQTNVPANLGKVIAIAAGATHTMALQSDGGVVEWGSMSGSFFSDVRAIAAGTNYSMALKNDGTVVSRGGNSSDLYSVPAGLNGVTSITAGLYFALALKAPVVDCGTQLLNAGGTSRTLTVRNVGGAALNLSNLAVTGTNASDFTVGTNGMLTSIPAGGQTTFTVSFTPSAVGKRQAYLRIHNDDSDESVFLLTLTGQGFVLSPEISIAESGSPDLFQGKLRSWGGILSGIQPILPAEVSGVAKVALGSGHMVALKTDGTLSSWSFPNYGLPGNGFSGNESGQATTPLGLTGVTDIAAGGAHTLALKSDGTVVAWGENSSGQATVPLGLANVKSIAAGSQVSFALKTDGTVAAWGSNNYGMRNVPVGLSDIKAITVGSMSVMALKGDGTVAVWGSAAVIGAMAPDFPAGITDTSAVAAGEDSFITLKNDGTVRAWLSPFSTLLAVPPGLTGVESIAMGRKHAVALKNDNTVVAWGYADAAQTSVPAGLRGVTRASSYSGADSTVALTDPVVDYGLHLVNTPSTARTFTIKNQGNTELVISDVDVTGDHAADFNIVTTGMLNSVPAGGQTTFDVTFNPGALGLRQADLTVTSNDSDEGIFHIFLNGTGTTQLGLWRGIHGLAAGGAQDLAAPSGDGIANLLKFAFNMANAPGDLLHSNTAILPENGTSGLPRISTRPEGGITIQYIRRKPTTNPGITYIPQTSEDLVIWTPLDVIESNVESIDSTWDRVTVSATAPDTLVFGRVKVTAP